MCGRKDGLKIYSLTTYLIFQSPLPKPISPFQAVTSEKRLHEFPVIYSEYVPNPPQMTRQH
jgi:hypothetical protein